MDRLLSFLKDHRAITLESDEPECTPRAAECSPKDKGNCVLGPELEYASLRPAPFIKWGFTGAEIRLNDTPNMNRDYEEFKKMNRVLIP